MKLVKSGQLSGITGNAFSGGVSTAPIYISRSLRQDAQVGIQVRLHGDTGRLVASGSSIAVKVKVAHKRGGPYADIQVNNANGTPVPGGYVVKSGTSESNVFGAGTYFKMMPALAPWMKIHAIASKSASTKTSGLTYAIFGI